MQHDEVIWQVIRHNHCSFMAKIETAVFCRNPYNVTGICNRSSCPLANSRYATIRDHDGVLYLYMKTIERAHLPNKLWERVKLPRNYAKALEVIDKHMLYWPKLLTHKIKQRLTKMTQMRIRMRKLALKTREKIMTVPTKEKKREARREEKAVKAADVEKKIENELLERLKNGLYGGIVNIPSKIYNQILKQKTDMSNEEDKEEEEEEEEEEEAEVEYVEGYEELEEDDDMEDFVGLAKGDYSDDGDDDEDTDDETGVAFERKKGKKEITRRQQLKDDHEGGTKSRKKTKVQVEVEHESTSGRQRAVM